MGGASGKRAEARGGGGGMEPASPEAGTLRLGVWGDVPDIPDVFDGSDALAVPDGEWAGPAGDPDVTPTPPRIASSGMAPGPRRTTSSGIAPGPPPAPPGTGPSVREASPGVHAGCAPGPVGCSPCVWSAVGGSAGLGGVAGRGGTAGGGGVVGRGGMGARRASVLMHPPFPHVRARSRTRAVVPSSGCPARRGLVRPGTHTRTGGASSRRARAAVGVPHMRARHSTG